MRIAKRNGNNNMNYNLKKKVEKNLKVYQLKSNSAALIEVKYPDPSKHEFTLEDGTSMFTLNVKGEEHLFVRQPEPDLDNIMSYLNQISYWAFELYFKHYDSFEKIIKQTKGIQKPKNYAMRMNFYDESGRECFVGFNWTHVKACFDIVTHELERYQYVVEFYKDCNKNTLQIKSYLEWSDALEWMRYNLEHHPTKRYFFPNDTEWHDSDYKNFVIN